MGLFGRQYISSLVSVRILFLFSPSLLVCHSVYLSFTPLSLSLLIKISNGKTTQLVITLYDKPDFEQDTKSIMHLFRMRSSNITQIKSSASPEARYSTVRKGKHTTLSNTREMRLVLSYAHRLYAFFVNASGIY